MFGRGAGCHSPVSPVISPGKNHRNESSIRFVHDSHYRGEGRSHGLARGLLVFDNEKNLTREGMGIGSPVILAGGNTYFSRSCYSAYSDEDTRTSSFLLDTGLDWGFGEHPVRSLTYLINRTVNVYLQHPSLQSFLPAGSMVRSLLGIRPIWHTVLPLGEIYFEYRVCYPEVEISCHIIRLVENVSSIILLNELGADVFTHVWSEGRICAPPSGWDRWPHDAWLYDPVHRLHFRIALEEVSPSVNADIFWGREHIMDLCWAGYGIALEGRLTGSTCRYIVTIEEEK